MGGGSAMFLVQLFSVRSVCLKLLSLLIREIAYAVTRFVPFAPQIVQMNQGVQPGTNYRKISTYKKLLRKFLGPRWSLECNYLRRKPVMQADVR